MCIDVWSCALPRVDDSRRVHSISLQIYELFLFLQFIWPNFFPILASNVQIVFAKSISKSVRLRVCKMDPFYILFFIILFFPETECQVIKIKGATPYDVAPSVLRIERVRAEVVDASDK